MRTTQESLFSILFGASTKKTLELITSDTQLSGEGFPLFLLSAEDQTVFRGYQQWLQSLPRRDANEIAFATLLSDDVNKVTRYRVLQRPKLKTEVELKLTFSCSDDGEIVERGHLGCEDRPAEGGFVVCTKEKREGGTMSFVVEENKKERANCNLPARIVIRGIQIPFEDYLSLEPGDEIDIGIVDQLEVHLVVGGITLGEGRLALIEDSFQFQMNKDSGNNSQESSIDIGDKRGETKNEE